jgi:hypothetical protein
MMQAAQLRGICQPQKLTAGRKPAQRTERGAGGNIDSREASIAAIEVFPCLDGIR